MEQKLRGNNEQIKQVMMILLDNALKYTNENGLVNITLKKRHHNIVLTVACRLRIEVSKDFRDYGQRCPLLNFNIT